MRDPVFDRADAGSHADHCQPGMAAQTPPQDRLLNGACHHYAPILAIIGLGLSSLHQSSLGATYGVIKARPFWFKPEMSVLFMLSAIVGGISLTLFATMLSARLTPKAKINDALIERVAQFVGYLLIGYFYFRAWDALSQPILMTRVAVKVCIS